MSVFKKSGEGFLARLFKHKKIDELAEELAHTYADEMQGNMLSENAETEQIPMLEVTKSGEVDFDDQPENSEENLPLPTEKGAVPNQLKSGRSLFQKKILIKEAMTVSWIVLSLEKQIDLLARRLILVLKVR